MRGFRRGIRKQVRRAGEHISEETINSLGILQAYLKLSVRLDLDVIQYMHDVKTMSKKECMAKYPDPTNVLRLDDSTPHLIVDKNGVNLIWHIPRFLEHKSQVRFFIVVINNLAEHVRSLPSRRASPLQPIAEF
jgi:hypothetical protein